MITQELVEFIRRQKEIGVSKSVVHKMLTEHGWDASDVEEGYESLEKEAIVLDGVTPVKKEPELANVEKPLVSFSMDKKVEDYVSGDSLIINNGDPSEEERQRVNLSEKIDTILNSNLPKSTSGKIDSFVSKNPENKEAGANVIKPKESTLESPVIDPYQEYPTLTKSLEPTSVKSQDDARVSENISIEKDGEKPFLVQDPVMTPKEPELKKENTFQPERLGMQTIATSIEGNRSGNKRNKKKILFILIPALLLVALIFQFLGIIKIPGLPIFFDNSRSVWKSTIASLINTEDIRAIEYNVDFSLASERDPGNRVVLSVDAKHEYFSKENQIGTYIFDLSTGQSSLAGEVRFQGDDVLFRATRASEDISMAGLTMSEFEGDWFVFSGANLKQNGNLIFNPNSFTSLVHNDLSFGEILKDVLTGAEELPVVKVEKTEGENFDQENIQVGLVGRLLSNMASRLATVADPYIQGHLDNPGVVEVLEYVSADVVDLSVDKKTGNVENAYFELRSFGGDGNYKGELEIEITSINKSVEPFSVLPSSTAFDEYMIAKIDREDLSKRAVDGDRLLLDLLQNARLKEATALLAEAQRRGQVLGLENSSYTGLCSSAGVEEALEEVTATFPNIVTSCRTDGIDFSLSGPFDVGYICADSTQYIGIIDEDPKGVLCVDNKGETTLPLN